MVRREARFHDCRITDVEEELPGVCFRVDFSAERADWFSPDDPSAGPDGWLRGLTDVSAEMRVVASDHAAALARARRWMDEGTALRGFSDLERQALGLLVAGASPLGPEDCLVIRTDERRMDRP